MRRMMALTRESSPYCFRWRLTVFAMSSLITPSTGTMAMRSPTAENPPPSVITAMIAKRLTTNRPQRIAPMTKIHARELLFITDNRLRERPARSAFQDEARIEDRGSRIEDRTAIFMRSSILDLRSSILDPRCVDLALRFFAAGARGAGVEIGDLEESGHAGIARRVIAHVKDWLVLADGARRQADLARLAIHLQDFELQSLSLFHRVFRFVDVIFGQFGDVAQTFNAVFEFHERAEIGEAGDFAGHQIAEMMGVEKFIPGVRLEVLDRERKAAIFDIDRRDDRFDFLILLERFRRMFDALGPGDV